MALYVLAAPYILGAAGSDMWIYSYVVLPRGRLIYAEAKFEAQGAMEADPKSGVIQFRERHHDKPAWHRVSKFTDPVLDVARRRIGAGSYPESLREFAGEILKEDFRYVLPDDRPSAITVERIIRNSDEWRSHWHRLFRSRRKR